MDKVRVGPVACMSWHVRKDMALWSHAHMHSVFRACWFLAWRVIICMAALTVSTFCMWHTMQGACGCSDSCGGEGTAHCLGQPPTEPGTCTHKHIHTHTHIWHDAWVRTNTNTHMAPVLTCTTKCMKIQTWHSTWHSCNSIKALLCDVLCVFTVQVPRSAPVWCTCECHTYPSQAATGR